MQLLRLLKNQETDSIKAACQICGITPKHGYDLWKKYREQGLAKYLQLDWQPRRSKLSGEQQAQLPERAATENGFGSQAEAVAYLQSEFAVSSGNETGILLNLTELRRGIEQVFFAWLIGFFILSLARLGIIYAKKKKTVH